MLGPRGYWSQAQYALPASPSKLTPEQESGKPAHETQHRGYEIDVRQYQILHS